MKLTLFVLICVTALALMWPSFNGMTITSDGVNYMSIAQNIAHGNGVVNYTGNVELVHPFLYSIVMAPFIILGSSMMGAAFAVNLLSLIAVGCMAWLLLVELTDRRDWPATLGTLCVMSNGPLMTFTQRALTETMCAALVLTFTWLCVKASTKKPWRWLLLASAVAMAGCFTRYTFFAFILGAGIFLKSWRDRVIVLGPAFLIGVVGFFTTKALHPYLDYNPHLFKNILNAPFGMVQASVGLIVFCVVVGLVVKNWDSILARMLAGIVVVYVVGLMALCVESGFNPSLDSRLFVPAVPVVLILLIGLFMRRPISVVELAPYVLTGLTITVITGAVVTAQQARPPTAKILNAPHFRHSSIIAAIDSLPDSTIIYDNCQSVVWLLTGKRTKAIPNTGSPPGTPYNSDTIAPRKTGGLMVWFDYQSDRYFPPEKFYDIMQQTSTGVMGIRDSTGLMVLIRKDTNYANRQ